MLAVDLLGERGDDFLEEIIRRPDIETSISHVVDYLCSRAGMSTAVELPCWQTGGVLHL